MVKRYPLADGTRAYQIQCYLCDHYGTERAKRADAVADAERHHERHCAA